MEQSNVGANFAESAWKSLYDGNELTEKEMIAVGKDLSNDVDSKFDKVLNKVLPKFIRKSHYKKITAKAIDEQNMSFALHTIGGGKKLKKAVSGQKCLLAKNDERANQVKAKINLKSFQGELKSQGKGHWLTQFLSTKGADGAGKDLKALRDAKSSKLNNNDLLKMGDQCETLSRLSEIAAKASSSHTFFAALEDALTPEEGSLDKEDVTLQALIGLGEDELSNLEEQFTTPIEISSPIVQEIITPGSEELEEISTHEAVPKEQLSLSDANKKIEEGFQGSEWMAQQCSDYLGAQGNEFEGSDAFSTFMTGVDQLLDLRGQLEHSGNLDAFNTALDDALPEMSSEITPETFSKIADNLKAKFQTEIEAQEDPEWDGEIDLEDNPLNSDDLAFNDVRGEKLSRADAGEAFFTWWESDNGLPEAIKQTSSMQFMRQFVRFAVEGRQDTFKEIIASRVGEIANASSEGYESDEIGEDGMAITEYDDIDLAADLLADLSEYEL